MDTGKLKKFAQAARRDLIQQVAGKLEQVLAEGSLARREQARAVAELEKQIQAHGRDEIVERAAYTWFNRFTALRFMDAHRYNRIMAVSPAEGQSQPEILAEAKQGHIDERVVPEKLRERVFALLDGRTPSRDAQGEGYRLLLVAVCNHWHQAMPFLFERIADWTELLMPDDLLSDNSVRTRIRTVLSAEDCQDVEVIGWLYQFYISEKKDEVFARPKNKKIEARDIPAATQLFTPHWIVRYLVENSLGRLWLLNRPQSKLAQRMEYYIAPEEPESDFLRINKPEDIRICDPACGSGHMLTYAFDLLHAIYEEEGYDPADIPGLILKRNLYGLEIDDRAGALAAFALMMKTAERLGRRKFLRLDAQPDICVLQDVSFNEDELNDYMAEVGRDLFTAELRETLGQFEQAKNFGSLIQPTLQDPGEVRRVLATKNFEGNLFLHDTHHRVLNALWMAETLSSNYHVVVANPPYMGWGGMNDRLQAFSKSQYPDSKNDLFSMFMERGLAAALPLGFMAMINMQTWMFLSSFEKLRRKVTAKSSLVSMAHLGERAFDTIGGAVVSTTAFILENQASQERFGDFLRLVGGRSENEKSQRARDIIKGLATSDHYRTRTADILKIPGNPIAYWISNFSIFDHKKLSAEWFSGGRLKTHDGPKYLRYMWEVNADSSRWKRVVKGGEFRRFYGNEETVADWSQGALSFYREMGGLPPQRFWGKNGLSWTKITTSSPSFRVKRSICEYDSAAPTIFSEKEDVNIEVVLGFLNTKVSTYLLDAINPTMNFQVADVLSLPLVDLPTSNKATVKSSVIHLIDISKRDWNAYETSWDFTSPPLLSSDHRAATVEATCTRICRQWRRMTDEMQRLEEENNRIFIDAYGLQDVLTPEVPIEEITLTCNAAYRYGGKLSDKEREQRLLADTMTEFLSYAVGCMFGRYSLDEPGLILANQGETLANYLASVPEPTFMPDDDNVIPILDDTWFTDDIVERFHDFLRLSFGEEHFQENLAFIESALGKPLRKYFVKDFYKDHVKRYKKRPIYWLFSSPKGSFNALIYMHRYRSDTVSVILNDYLREFRTKLGARVQQLEEIEASASSSARDKTAALKEITKLRDTIAELEDWERKVLLPLASEKIEIDLDDGVKANYPKFGSALAKIPGLS